MKTGFHKLVDGEWYYVGFFNVAGKGLEAYLPIDDTTSIVFYI